MENILSSESEIELFLNTNNFTVLYFSTPDCTVCKVLKPKLIEFLEENFSKFKFGYVDLSQLKESAAQRNIFTVPTILFLYEGKEFIRKARHINFGELYDELSRFYSMVE
ncbi:MAG: thioredoxin [Ignavibacteriales bacterium CG_4_9_14_3_um_filter_34_10]|nr:MAG: thioredoxin [Ignavibacteriales bacterium CG_4_9_14_3_um_filter_34_10]